ncbi:hypothetical protein [Flavobacterium granuli]|uniref:Sulfatase n=1 Tax=Flavobacterium granuli TaxID=280093 RepID=A0ABU1S3C2_9FLAO|nr:hypothetical protein [Flavobacterium granuli]
MTNKNDEKSISTFTFFSMFISFMTFGQASKKQPNIIVIISDDHAYQSIGAYGVS